MKDDTPRKKFLGEYELVSADYEFRRSVNGRGEITSEVAGGVINVEIDGLGDGTLQRWLFRPANLEDGQIVTMDGETTTGKLSFARAKVVLYRLHFDSNTRSGATSILKIEAGDMSTDNDLYFEKK